MCNRFFSAAACSIPNADSVAASPVDSQSEATPPTSQGMDFFERSFEDALAQPSEVLCLKPGERCVDTVSSGVFQVDPGRSKARPHRVPCVETASQRAFLHITTIVPRSKQGVRVTRILENLQTTNDRFCCRSRTSEHQLNDLGVPIMDDKFHLKINKLMREGRKILQRKIQEYRNSVNKTWRIFL